MRYRRRFELARSSRAGDGPCLFIVGMVGFSRISAVHNAAHDVRHANAFPCHRREMPVSDQLCFQPRLPA
ncbi:MAG TPA: CbtB-domain containing protein [Bradyrhizobium sp.]|nr:CbtB-domain containing protein [Bradyrhizobium sp.]